MHKYAKAPSNDMDAIAEDARALMTATADAEGERISHARNRLAAAVERGKQAYERVREKASDSVRAADEAVREHPYRTIAIGFGIGALLGYVVSSRRTRNGD